MGFRPHIHFRSPSRRSGGYLSSGRRRRSSSSNNAVSSSQSRKQRDKALNIDRKSEINMIGRFVKDSSWDISIITDVIAKASPEYLLVHVNSGEMFVRKMEDVQLWKLDELFKMPIVLNKDSEFPEGTLDNQKKALIKESKQVFMDAYKNIRSLSSNLSLYDLNGYVSENFKSSLKDFFFVQNHKYHQYKLDISEKKFTADTETESTRFAWLKNKEDYEEEGEQ